ncbi:PDC sensor domain-containing protein [Bacillus alkalicola]
MDKQHLQIQHLQTVSGGLHESSATLAESINKLDVKQKVEMSHLDFEDMKELLLEVCVKEELKTLDKEIHEDILTDYLSKTFEMEAIWSNRTDGTFIFSKPEAGLFNARQRDWWKKAMEGDQFLSKPYVSAITKQPCVTLSRALRNEKGEIIGMVGMDIRV